MATARKLIIGVDVGGTNTDAVLLDPTKTGPEAVVAAYKATTGANVTTGIEEAIRALLDETQVSPGDVASLMIGTTHLINAVVERDASRLEPVAVIRLAAHEYLTHTPTFIDFPADLKKIMNGHQGRVSGGVQIDGTLIAAVDEAEVLEQARLIKQKGLRSVAIVGIYSPLDETYHQEERVRDILQGALGDVDVVCSREIAGVGILARENATILNASLLRFARRTIAGFRRAMKGLRLACPLYLTSSAGQLLSAADATRFPIQIFASGPTNSIRGAAFLSTEQTDDSRFVVDIGGTTADVGCMLPNGCPRLAGATAAIGGVTVNFALPQVESIGLGGGSRVHQLPDGRIRLGPDSVGQALRDSALCFGGNTLTATDIQVAAGAVQLGTAAPQVDAGLVAAARTTMARMLADHIDRMKTSPAPCRVLLVGGGAFLCPPTLEGVASIETPAHANVANAVGAAVAEIGARAEAVVDAAARDTALVTVRAQAIAQAIARGARADAIRTVDEDVAGLAYMEGKFRIAVQVAGPVDYGRFLVEAEAEDDLDENDVYIERKQSTFDTDPPDDDVDHATYRPRIDVDRIWHLSPTDVHYLAIGCYILGCAGGGTPYGPYLQARELLRNGGAIRVIDVHDLPVDAQCCPVAAMGSPVLAIERLGGTMVGDALRALERHLHVPCTAVLTAEIGGANGLSPLLLAASTGRDLVCLDADLMGRAFPAFQMSSLYLGAPNGDINHLLPVCLASGDGTELAIASARDVTAVDQLLRAATVTMGFGAGVAARPATKTELLKYGVLGSVSLAWRLGRAVCRARAAGTIGSVHVDLVRELGGPTAARKVFAGKVVGIEQRLYGGRSQGTLLLAQLQGEEEDGPEDPNEPDEDGPSPVTLSIPFVNENLLLEATYADGTTKILATVPDLIMVLDTLTGEAVGVPEYRYGLKVFVLVAAAHPLWTRSTEALAVAGPRAFGYDMDFVASGTYTGVASVIDEYGPAV